jgi:hypothetical protein
MWNCCAACSKADPKLVQGADFGAIPEGAWRAAPETSHGVQKNREKALETKAFCYNGERLLEGRSAPSFVSWGKFRKGAENVTTIAITS